MTMHTGGCHCGAVRFDVEAAFDQVIACNCSICSKRAHLLSFVPAAQFRLLSGGDQLTDYQFGRKSIHHLFCRICGIESYATGSMPDGTPMVAVNVRCIDGIDVDALAVSRFDGRSI